MAGRSRRACCRAVLAVALAIGAAAAPVAAQEAGRVIGRAIEAESGRGLFFFTAANELGGETTQPRNGESGWIRGAELALQQQLRFLPGARMSW